MTIRDISAAGFSVVLRASVTFPQGFTITAFADDADPFDTPAIALAEKATALNGDLVVWSKATPIEVTIQVIPGSGDDANLAILAEANRVSQGKNSARDVCAMTAFYPDGRRLTLDTGRIMAAPVGTSVASSGRQKTKAYTFAFQGRSGSVS